MLLINEIKCPLEYSDDIIISKLSHKLKTGKSEIRSFKIIKRSIDARKEIMYVLQMIVDVKQENKYLKIPGVTRYIKEDLSTPKISKTIRPIIVGYGPSGIFASYRLVEAGLKPIIFEKGSRIAKRVKDVETFFEKGILNPNSNVQFGEGGAGTFSDAKLTTRIKNPFIDYILDIFVKNGADKTIKIDAHPHIGTDKIRNIITNITDEMIKKGAEFHFDEELKDLIIENDKVKGILTDKNTYYGDTVILATGHSAFETIKMLKNHQVAIKNKDFAIGFRVEHPQSIIDINQYGNINKVEILSHAEYFLRYQGNRGVYSFCMCPGGIVVPASSEEKTIVTNGMSYVKRDSGIANSAILVQVNSDDYDSEDVLSGFNLLHKYEEKAYQISGSYKALSMNIKDYMNNELNPLIFNSTYPLGTYLYNLNNFFNPKFNIDFKNAISHFDQKIKGFINDGIMVAPETRSSCPVRIERNESGQSVSTNGLYPCGEGSGYGGGIMSCAIDGIRIANKILDKLS